MQTKLSVYKLVIGIGLMAILVSLISVFTGVDKTDALSTFFIGLSIAGVAYLNYKSALKDK